MLLASKLLAAKYRRFATFVKKGHSMKTLLILSLTLGLAAGTARISYAAGGSDPTHILLPSAPRTVTISEADTPPTIRTGLLQATHIVPPQEEKVATVFGGDTVNWVFDGGHVVSRFISVKPKTVGGTTDLHIVSDHGNEYTLQLHEVSAEADPHFDSKVMIAPGDQTGKDKLAALPVFVPAAELEKAKADAAAAQAEQLASAKAQASNTEEYRSHYPGTLHFDYIWDRKKGDALGLQQVWHDDKFTYQRGQFQETPALYEVKDGKFSHQFRLRRWTLHHSQTGVTWLPHHRQTEGAVLPDRRGEVAMIDSDNATVPEQPVFMPPLKKGFPVALILIGVIVVIALANLTNLVGSRGKTATRSNLSAQPSSISPQQVKSYQTMQATEARRDAEDRQQHGITQSGPASQQAAGYSASDIPGPEADTAAPMTAAQRQSIYGDSPNAPQKTSNASQAHAEARQRQLAREKQQQDAINSDTVAIDCGRPSGSATNPANALAECQ